MKLKAFPLKQIKHIFWEGESLTLNTKKKKKKQSRFVFKAKPKAGILPFKKVICFNKLFSFLRYQYFFLF